MCSTIYSKQYALCYNYGSLQCSHHPYELTLFIQLTPIYNVYSQPMTKSNKAPSLYLHPLMYWYGCNSGRKAENGHQTHGNLCLTINFAFTQA